MLKTYFHKINTLYVLFFFSGISGLIYEIIWLRMLNRVLGSTVYATSIVLASFMAGMALGSYFIGKNSPKIKDKLQLFSFLEMGTGLSSLLILILLPYLVPLYRIFYAIAGGQRIWLSIFQSLLMFLILLIPTSLMGGTLPMLAGFTKTYHANFANRLGLLYGLNTFGAVFGVAASGLYLIGEFGEYFTLLSAVFISFCVAFLAYSMSKSMQLYNHDKVLSNPKESENNLPISEYDDVTRKIVLLAYGLSGFAAMAYEIIWTRLFQIQVGTSIYAFSLMLAFYLLGIAFGSIAAGRTSHQIINPLLFFGTTQFFIAFYGIIGMYIFAIFQPFSFSAVYSFSNGALISLLIVFPITFILGYIFPIVSRIYVKNEAEASEGIGRLYSSNTLGCILGSLVSGFVLIGFFGTRGTILFLAGLNFLIGLFVIFRPSNFPGFKRNLIIGFFLAATVFSGFYAPDPFIAALHKAINPKTDANTYEFYYNKESVFATTTAFGIKNQPLSNHLWINGIGMTGLCVETKIMAHLPLLLHQNPKDLLVVCFGMGTTLRSAWAHKGLKIDVVELIPETYETFKYFHSNGPQILADPRVNHYADDGRNFLQMRSKKYDIITMDPAPPLYSAGSVNLYTTEFFDLGKRRLNPDGIMTVWIPPSPFTEMQMIMKSFFLVFPNSYVCGGPNYPGLYLLGFNNQSRPDTKRVINAKYDPAILADLNEWGDYFHSPKLLLNLLVLKPKHLSNFVYYAKAVSDDHPYTEFPLWRSLFDESYKWNLDSRKLLAWRKKIYKD